LRSGWWGLGIDRTMIWKTPADLRDILDP
jgi:hypothetical protein